MFEFKTILEFTKKFGTMFENSNIPLQKWFVAIYIISLHKKGISSVQLAKDLDITQKSACFLENRIKMAMSTQSLRHLATIKEFIMITRALPLLVKMLKKKMTQR